MKVIIWRVNSRGETKELKLLDKKLWLNWIFTSSYALAATATDPSVAAVATGSTSFGRVVYNLLSGPGQILVTITGLAFIYYVLKWVNDAFDMGMLNSVLRLLIIILAVWLVISDISLKMNKFLRGDF